jgi:hypothetical protein
LNLTITFKAAGRGIKYRRVARAADDIFPFFQFPELNFNSKQTFDANAQVITAIQTL